MVSLLGEAQQPIFSQINLEQGLAHKEVNALYQDRFGFIWIGTEDGLQQYDGYRFTTYRHDSEKPLASLSSDDINLSISGDRKGRIWIVTEHKGITRWDPNTGEFSVFNTDRDSTLPQSFNRCHNLVQDRWGNTYVSTFDGAYRIDTNDQIISISHEQDGSPRIPHLVTNGIRMDSTGNLWLNHASGLSRYDPRSDTWYGAEHNPHGSAIFDIQRGATSMTIASDGVLWVSCYEVDPVKPGRPLYRFDPIKNTLDTFTILLPKQNAFDDLVISMLDDGPGLWLGTANNGLLYFDKSTGEITQYLSNPEDAFPLSSNHVATLMKDRDGNLWIGTNNGISILPASYNRIRLYDKLSISNSTKAPAGEVSSALLLPDSSLALTIKSYGIYRAPKGWPAVAGFTRIVPPAQLKGEWIDYSQLLGRVGNLLLVQFWYGETWMYNTITGQWNRIVKPDEFEGLTLYRMVWDSLRNHAWFGTRGGLYAWDPAQNKVLSTYLIPDDRESVKVFDIASSGDTALWLGTGDHGLWELSLQSGKTRGLAALPTSLTGFRIFDLDWAGNKLLIGTERNGLFEYDPLTSEVHHFTRNNGLKSNRIKDIEPLGNGQWMVVTERGWATYIEGQTDLTSMESRLQIPPTLINYTTILSRNRFLVWCSDLLISVNQKRKDQEGNLAPLTPRLTALRLFDQDIPAGVLSKSEAPHFNLGWSENILTASFSTLDFINQDFVEFAYQLNDHGERWESLGNHNSVVLSNLPSGNHKLRVRARYPNEEWSEPVTVMSFRLAAPFWRQAWFYLVIAMALGAIGFWLYRQRITRRLAVEQIRNQVSRDLHDDLGSGLSSVAIMSNLASRNVQANRDETQPLLSQIEENVQDMQDRLQEMVWALHPRNDTLGQLVARLRSFAHPVLESKNIRFSISLPHELEHIKLSLIQRKNLFLALKEAINNAAKYSEANSVALTFERTVRKLQVSVQDDGIGFDMEQIKRGNGLDNISSRAREAGGTCQWTVSPGGGCTLIIQLPITS